MSKQHIVFYCDGGFLLDSKIGGAGAHGYIYKGMSEKQENILGKWTPTEEGYVLRTEDVPSVDIIGYVDIIKGLNRVGSSAHTELHAINKALEWFESYDGQSETATIRILCDSKNIISGLGGWMKKWKSNGWKLSTGNPPQFLELWQEVDERLERISPTTKINFEWIKGHDGNLGNEKADNLATRGILLNKNGDDQLMTVVSEFRGYWNVPSGIRPPRLLEGPRLYTDTYDRVEDSDEGDVYCIGSHGAKDRLAEEQGKVYPCNYLSVIRVNKKDPVIHQMRELVKRLEVDRGGVQGTLVTFNLQNLMTSRFYAEVLQDGLTFTERRKRPIIVNTAAGAPLAEEIIPVGRAFRLADYCRTSRERLKDIDEDRLIRRDSMIDIFFDKITKKDKSEEYKIKPTITSATKSIKFDGKFSTSTKDLSEVTFTRKITLILGIDTPTRNTLSALAKEIDVLDLVSWRESENSVRYGVYVRLKDGEDGLWTKYDSNLLIGKV